MENTPKDNFYEQLIKKGYQMRKPGYDNVEATASDRFDKFVDRFIVGAIIASYLFIGALFYKSCEPNNKIEKPKSNLEEKIDINNKNKITTNLINNF